MKKTTRTKKSKRKQSAETTRTSGVHTEVMEQCEDAISSSNDNKPERNRRWLGRRRQGMVETSNATPTPSPAGSSRAHGHNQRQRLSLFRRRSPKNHNGSLASSSHTTTFGGLLNVSLNSGRSRRRRQRQHSARNDTENRIASSSSSSSSSSTEEIVDANSSGSDVDTSVLDRTTIVAETTIPHQPRHENPIEEDGGDDNNDYNDADADNVDGRGNARSTDNMVPLERQETPQHYSCSTAILKHSYFENMCTHRNALEVEPNDYTEGNAEFQYQQQQQQQRSRLSHLPEDPTVQESIECIFASQLEEGLNLWDDDDESNDGEGVGSKANGDYDHNIVGDNDNHGDDDDDDVPLNRNRTRRELVSPSTLLQSRHTRSERQIQETEPCRPAMHKRKSSNATRTASLMYMGTHTASNDNYDGSSCQFIHDGNNSNSNTNNASGRKYNAVSNESQKSINIAADAQTVAAAAAECSTPRPCRCGSSHLPVADPSKWPQAPLMLRPTPGSGTIVKGVRFVDSSEYFWKPGSFEKTWSDALMNHWNKPPGKASRGQFTNSCPQCCILPINNGNEKKGESIVVDFESELFDGSLMLRLRHAEGTTPQPYDDSRGYFHGMNRRYQAVIRGKFKEAIPWTELVTGFCLNRPCGKLPPKWILKGGIKVISFFAPQLDVQWDVPKPYSLSPLGSTPQSIAVEDTPRQSLEDLLVEPKAAKDTLMGEAHSASTSLQRARARKKAFDKLYVHRKDTFRTDPTQTYTFEFLQHLFNFQDFSMELGSMLGSIQLGDILDGQPFQIMATHQRSNNPLWSFDLWHTCLWDAAKKHDGTI